MTTTDLRIRNENHAEASRNKFCGLKNDEAKKIGEKRGAGLGERILALRMPLSPFIAVGFLRCVPFRCAQINELLRILRLEGPKVSTGGAVLL